MKLSEIYGMEVSREDGGVRGYVIKVYADGEKITGALCADERENEFYVSSANMRLCDSKITFKTFEKTVPDGVPLALGRACFNVFGEYVGVLRDVTCRGFKLASAKIGGKSYAAQNLVFGDAVIIKPSAAALKTDVKKDGKTLFRSGAEPDQKLIARAISLGEYVQTSLKSI